MKEKYEAAQEAYSALKKRANDIINPDQNLLSFDELIDLTLKTDLIEDLKIDDQIEIYKMNIFIKKCQILQDQIIAKDESHQAAANNPFDENSQTMSALNQNMKIKISYN